MIRFKVFGREIIINLSNRKEIKPLPLTAYVPRGNISMAEANMLLAQLNRIG